MTEEDARRLALRCTDTWPEGTRGYVWREVFSGLDQSLALDAYVHLTKTARRPPTPGAFREAYDALQRAEHHQREANERPAPYQATSFADYLARLTARADRGDAVALDELEAWNVADRVLNRTTDSLTGTDSAPTETVP